MDKSDLKPFQKRFIKAVESPAYDVAALSIPRGNGKTTLSGWILARCLTPGDLLHQAGKEYVLLASSLEQARLCFRVVREILEPKGGYRWTDSTQRIGAVHLASNTRLRVISSSAKHSFGLVGVALCVLDEPGSLEAVGGSLLADSLFSALSKPDSPMMLVLIGTLAPSTSGWWPELVKAGTTGTTYVQSLIGDRAKWDSWREIQRVNPLMCRFPDSRRKLLQERDAAREDSRLRARFLSFRMNLPSQDDAEVLLSVEDWDMLLARPPAPREGAPLIGVDLGSGRAWSAAVAMWETGRIEAFALAPGLPSLRDQERRDHTPAGLYEKLAADGLLLVDDGLRVQRPEVLWHEICQRFGFPQLMIADRFRAPELEDATEGRAPLEQRVTRWSEAAADIRALRRGVLDGPFSIGAGADLIEASVAVSQVKNDDQGNTRLSKRGSNNTGRDDVAAALVLVAGAYERMILNPPAPAAYHGLIQ